MLACLFTCLFVWVSLLTCLAACWCLFAFAWLGASEFSWFVCFAVCFVCFVCFAVCLLVLLFVLLFDLLFVNFGR